MNLYDYFENTSGIGVLATSDSQGIVDTALYARPHFVDEATCVFLMADKLTHKNLTENPHASYLFLERSLDYRGKRLYLTKTKESNDPDLAGRLRRKSHDSLPDKGSKHRTTFVTYFRVDTVRPLVGDDARRA